MKKLFVMLLCLSFVFSTLLVSCKNQAKGERLSKKGELDHDLKLVKLEIFDTEIDLDKMEFEVSEKVIDVEDITAWFDYGDTKEEAIGVSVSGGEVFNVGSAEFMILSVPEVKSKYKAWSKKVKVSFVKKEMNLVVGWDYTSQPSGAEEEFDSETVCLSVIAGVDVIQSVTLNYNETDVEIPIVEGSAGPTSYCVASSVVLLPTDEAKEYTITVKPKDNEVYEDTVVSYSLKGIKIPTNNAEFMYREENEMDIVTNVTWKEGCKSIYPQDYGASSISAVCRTVSPRAKVMAKIVNPKDESQVIGQEIELACADKNGVHTGNINLLQDMPTLLVLYVVAEDGNTKDNNRGKWSLMYNPMDLYWDYDPNKIATAELRKNKTEEYASIDVTKAEVNNNKIYLVFVTWAKDFGFVPKDANNCIELDTFGGKNERQTAYRLDVDVSTLNVGQSKDVVFTIMKDKDISGEVIDPPVEAFGYKVTVNMK